MRLVDRVAQRRVEHAGHAGRPQRADGEHEAGRRAQADRQDHQREPDAEQPVDAAGEHHLDEQADERQVDGDLREKGGDAVGVGPALGLGRGHVELLLDDGRADGGKGDDQGDDLQMPGAAQQGDGLAAANPFFLTRLGRVGPAGALIGADDAHHDGQAHGQDGGADEQHRRRAQFLDQRRGDGGTERPAQTGAAADETEQALGLARVVDVVGQGPELADEQDAEHQPVEVEPDRNPLAADLGEEHPEDHEQHDHAGLRDRDRPPARHAGHELGIGLHQHADDHAGGELDPRQIVGAEAGDELRPRDRLDDVVGRHREERVEEQQQRRSALAGAQLGQRRQPAGEQGRTRLGRGHG